MIEEIYIITDGEHSAYHICGVFDNEELAKKFVDKFGGRKETWKICPSDLIEMLEHGYNVYIIYMDLEGNTIFMHISNHWYDICQAIKESTSTFGDGTYESLYMRILAKDEKSAIKITNERRMLYKTKYER